MAEKETKYTIKSHSTGKEQLMTEKEFSDFQKSVDPQKRKFYNAGVATPEEAQKAPADAKGPAAPRTSAAN